VDWGEGGVVMMKARRILAAALLGMAVAVQAASAQQATPTAPLSKQANEAKDRIQFALSKMISGMPDDSFLQNGIAASDISRAKGCVVQAVVADIPDDAAKRVADKMYHNPPIKDDEIEKWVFAAFSRHNERRQQVLDQVKKLCPEFERAFAG
jgi:hypothetical protein